MTALTDRDKIAYIDMQIEMSILANEVWIFHQEDLFIPPDKRWRCIVRAIGDTETPAIINVTGAEFFDVINEAYLRLKRLIAIAPEYSADLLPGKELIR